MTNKYEIVIKYIFSDACFGMFTGKIVFIFQ